MKPRFAINLIRDETPPKAKRIRLYWLIMGYLLLAGVLLAIECHLLTKRFIHRQANAVELQRLGEQFRKSYPAQASAAAYIEDMGRRLEEEDARLDAVRRLLQGRVDVAPILVGLRAALPQDMPLGDLLIDPAKRLLEFDVIAGPGDQIPLMQPSELTEAWNADAELARHVGSLETVLTERRRLKGAELHVYRFSARLLAGGGE